MSAHKHTPMVVAAARALCRRDSDLCNVDFDDNWKIYGDGFLADAQVALESAAATELLEALVLSETTMTAALQECGYEPCSSTDEWTPAVQAQVAALVSVRAAIAKAGAA
ncbi:hypothetical protein D3C81_386550 [compost metagenome]